MKRKKYKTVNGGTENAHSKRSKTFVIGAGVIVLVAAAYFLVSNHSFETKTEPSQIVRKEEQVALRPEDAYSITVRRAYAIDVKFQQVYNAAWEAANGAIGEAFLYAATGDPNLLKRYTSQRKLTDMFNGTWVDDRAWVCLAELYWWQFSGRTNKVWVEDAEKRYEEAKNEGRLSNHEGFWSWYSWPPNSKVDDMILTNSNTNQMVTVACMLYEATHERRFYNDAMLVWEGDSKYPGIVKTFYRGDGKWEGKGGMAAFGKQLPWEGASYLSVVAAMYRMTGNPKYKMIAIESAKRIMDPSNGWVDSTDFYQLRMDGNGAFVHFILDAYSIAPELLPDIPMKVERMLEHVWSNHHGASYVLLHRLSDDGIRNGWNPNGGEEGYGVDQIGTVHAQSQALRAFGVFAYVLHEELKKK
ncbi:MAG: hypothetical protein WBW71_08365 [Bacteroidota bacterium]